MKLRHCLALLFFWLAASVVEGADLRKAEMLRAHGLVQDAKREYIEIAISSGSEEADALYALGSIAFDEGKAYFGGLGNKKNS